MIYSQSLLLPRYCQSALCALRHTATFANTDKKRCRCSDCPKPQVFVSFRASTVPHLAMESTTASSSYEEECLEPTSNREKILVNNLLLKMIVHHHREVRVRQTFVPSSDTTTKRSRITTSEHTESHNQPRPQTSPHTHGRAPQPQVAHALFTTSRQVRYGIKNVIAELRLHQALYYSNNSARYLRQPRPKLSTSCSLCSSSTHHLPQEGDLQLWTSIRSSPDEAASLSVGEYY